MRSVWCLYGWPYKLYGWPYSLYGSSYSLYGGCISEFFLILASKQYGDCMCVCFGSLKPYGACMRLVWVPIQPLRGFYRWIFFNFNFQAVCGLYVCMFWYFKAVWGAVWGLYRWPYRLYGWNFTYFNFKTVLGGMCEGFLGALNMCWGCMGPRTACMRIVSVNFD